MALELRDHAHARPRAPDERDDPAGPAPVEPEGQLVEDLVGRGVIRLADVAEAAGDRREERRELERIAAHQPDQVQRSVELGLEHAVERFDRLVADELVLDQAGPVDQPDDFSVAGTPAVEHARPCAAGSRTSASAYATVAPACRRLLQVLADFAGAAQGLVGRLDLGRARPVALRRAAGRARRP